MNDRKEKTLENVKKVLREGKELELPINGEIRKIYWANIGFSSRVYYRSYIKSKVEEAEKIGLLSVKEGSQIFECKNQKVIPLAYESVIADSVSLTINGHTVTPDKYQVNMGTLLFEYPVNGKLEVEFKHYDEEIYTEIRNNATTCMLIYLSVRDIKDHNKKIFNSPEIVGELSEYEANQIIASYLDEIKVTEEDLENLAETPSSEEEEATQRDTE